MRPLQKSETCRALGGGGPWLEKYIYPVKKVPGTTRISSVQKQNSKSGSS